MKKPNKKLLYHKDKNVTRKFAEENLMAEKFDNWDRKRVIDEVQEYYDVKLEKVGGRDKWRRDESGKNWWILGGKDDWHGIPKEMMEDEEARCDGDGMLIIAQRKHTCLDVFSGLLHRLVNERDKLSRVRSTGDYQFVVRVSGDRLLCDRAPNVVLEKFATIPYTEEDKEQDKNRHEVVKALEKLSPEQIREVLAQLNS